MTSPFSKDDKAKTDLSDVTESNKRSRRATKTVERYGFKALADAPSIVGRVTPEKTEKAAK